MATYRVSVLLSVASGAFSRGLTAADRSTRKTESALKRASGAAQGLAGRTDEAGQRAQSALRRAAGSAGNLQGALRRTSSQARSTGDAIRSSAEKGSRSVRGLIGRFRELRRAMGEARAAGRGGAGGGGGGFGAGMVGRAAGLLGGGYALKSAAGRELSLQERLTALGVEAGRSDPEMLQVRRHIESVAGREDVRVPVSELLGAVEQYQRETGDFDQALANLETFAQGIQRTDSTGVDFGSFVSQLRKFGIQSADEVREATVMGIEAQRQGSLYLSDIATQGGRAMSFWASKQQGLEGWRDFLTTAQSSMSAAGNKREVAFSALTSTLAVMSDPLKIKEIEDLGVYGVKSRSPDDITRELIEATRGDASKLVEIFGTEAAGLFLFLSTEAGREFHRRVQAGTQPGNLDFALFESEVARKASTSESEINASRDRTQSLFSRLVGERLAQVVTLGTDNLPAIATGALGLAAAPTLWRGGRAAWRGGRRLLGRPAPEAPAAGAPRGRAPSTGGAGLGSIAQLHVRTLIATRVIGGGPLATASGAAGGAGKRGRQAGGPDGVLARAKGAVAGAGAGRLIRGAGAAGVVFGALNAGSALAQGDTAGAARSAGGTAGGIGGGALGAAIGTAVLPGIGTVVGGLIGAITGGLLGEATVGSVLSAASGGRAKPGSSHIAQARGRRIREDQDEAAGEGALSAAAGLPASHIAQARGRRVRGDQDEAAGEGALSAAAGLPASHIAQTRGRRVRGDQGEAAGEGALSAAAGLPASHIAQTRGRRVRGDQGEAAGEGALSAAAGLPASHIAQTRGRRVRGDQGEAAGEGALSAAAGLPASHIAQTRGRRVRGDQGEAAGEGALSAAAGLPASHIAQTRGRSRLIPRREPDPGTPIELTPELLGHVDNRVDNRRVDMGGVSVTLNLPPDAADLDPATLAERVADIVQRKIRDAQRELLDTSFEDPDPEPIF